MLNGKLVYLRPLEEEDKDIIFNWQSSERLRRMTGAVYPVSRKEHQRWFTSNLEEKTEKLFMIADLKTGERLGLIGTKNTDPIAKVTEFYYYIGDAKNHRHGFGSDAIYTLCAFYFNQLNFHKLYARVFEYNQASSRALEHLPDFHFILEATMKNHVFRDGRYWSVNFFSAFGSRDQKCIDQSV